MEKIAQEVANTAQSLTIAAQTKQREQLNCSIHNRLALATYVGRNNEYSVEKFRLNMKIVAGYCLIACGDRPEAVLEERRRQDNMWGDEFDRKNTANDWHAYIAHYLALALRSEYEVNMRKACGIAQAAMLMVDRYGAPAPRHYENLPSAGAKELS